MGEEDCQLTVFLSVEVDFKSLEDVGTFVDYTCANSNQKFFVGITGDMEVLGNWNPEKGIVCKQKSSDGKGIEVWQCRFTSDIDRVFHYRYFVAEVKHNNDEYSDSDMLRVLAWESRLHPRSFSILDYLTSTDKSSVTHVKFGVYDDGKFIQRGWLTTNSEIHVRLSGSACKFFNTGFLNSPHTQNHLYIACSKYVIQPSCQEEEVETVVMDKTFAKFGDSSAVVDRTKFVDSSATNPNIPSQPPLSTGTLSFTPCGQAQPVLLSTLEINRCRIHRGENNECWGTLYKLGDDVTFYVETNDVENTTVVVEFYLQEIKPLPKDALPPPRTPLRFVGSARFGPFESTHGRKASQILNAKQLPIGDLRVNFLVIHPMTKAPTPSLAVTYQHHWKKRGTVEIGHRGMGTSFFDQSERDKKKPATTKENTLDSFRTAVQHGADYVEMDVQLTKDHQVIVYHDYEAVIISKKKRGGKLSYLPIAIKDLNYEDLRELKVHHSSVLNEDHSHEKMDEDDLDPIELQSFPLLRSCFEEIDSDLGFLIEVKYPMEFKAGGSELSNFFEYNFYVDTILREILLRAGSRRILLSCFDPNVCVMLQLKQNLYPVFQLGIAPEYADSRHLDFERLFWSALSHQLLGVCLESDRLLTVPNAVKLAHLHSLVVLAWGEAVNYPEKRAELKELGVDGIIFDRLHESREKGTLSVFKRDRNAPSPICPDMDEPHDSQDALHLSNVNSTGIREQFPGPRLTPMAHTHEPSVAEQGFPVHAQFASTHVAVVKECVMFEKLSHSNSTTTCTSMPPTSLATFQPDLTSPADPDPDLDPEVSINRPEEVPEAETNHSTEQLQNAQPGEGPPVLADVAVRSKTSSTQHAVALITLA